MQTIMESEYVKTRGPFLLGGKKLLNPGSVVHLGKDMAKEFVRRNMGDFHAGPAFEAHPPHKGGTKADGTIITKLKMRPPEEDDDDEAAGTPSPERADLAQRIGRAEQAVARPQQAGKA
jgi:hypothetical protein